jgi:hypothetical protein
MLRIASALVIAGALSLPQVTLAQSRITVGQQVSGTLSSDDPVLGDDSHYDLYTFQARAGQRYAITLHSDAFDTYLAVGRGADGAGEQCDEDSDCETNDDGGEGTDSRIRFTASVDGVYSIRANSLEGGETGDYTLSLDEAPPAHEPTRAGISVGREVSGELAENDAEADDQSFYEEWEFRPDFTGRVVISMSSDDFDAFLKFGTGTGDDFQQNDFNDDAGDDGTDSELTVEVTAGETYTIQANSLSAGETGHYTLVVRRDS